MRKRIIAILMIALLAFGLAACGGSDNASSSGDEQTETAAALEQTTIKMALPGGAHTLHEIALAQGYYDEEGLTVEIVPVEDGTSAFTALKSGKVDFLSTFGTNLPLQYIGAGEDITIFGGYLLDGSMSVIAREGTEWNGVEDLIGKSIACEPSSYYISGPLLDLGHDPLNEVTWVDGLQRLERLEAVQKGEVDYAVMPTLQNWDALNTDGIEMMAYCGDILENYSCCRMEANTSWINDNPNTVKALLRTWIRAQDYFEAHADELAPSLAEAAGTEEKYVRAYLESGHYKMKVDPAKSCVVRAWNYLLTMGFFDEGADSIDINDHINTELYKAALDECQEKYGDSSEKENFYEEAQSMFSELDN